MGSISGWTTSVSGGDVFGFNVLTATTVTKIVGQIWCQGAGSGSGGGGTPTTTIFSSQGPLTYGSGSSGEANSLLQVKAAGSATALATNGSAEVLVSRPNCDGTNNHFGLLATNYSTDVADGMTMYTCMTGFSVIQFSAGSKISQFMDWEVDPASQSNSWDFANGSVASLMNQPNPGEPTNTNTAWFLYGKEDPTDHYFGASFNGGGASPAGLQQVASFGVEGHLADNNTLTDWRTFWYLYPTSKTIAFIDSTNPTTFIFDNSFTISMFNLFAAGVVNTPLVVGGTAVGSTLTLQSTTAVGTTDSIVAKVGNNGATTVWTAFHDGLLSVESLKTTGAAGSKKVVCVDTSTGKLYASSTGTDCSN
jgi:hypothetical protein